MLCSRLKKIIRDSRILVSRKASYFRSELNFCPKIFAGRQGCIAKIRGVGTRLVTSLGHQEGRVF